MANLPILKPTGLKTSKTIYGTTNKGERRRVASLNSRESRAWWEGPQEGEENGEKKVQLLKVFT